MSPAVRDERTMPVTALRKTAARQKESTVITDIEATNTTWQGYWPAATTPFGRNGDLDETAWRESLDLFASFGVHGVLVNGSSGEWFSQTNAERRRVAEIAVEQVNGRFPVVVGCTGYTPETVVSVAKDAVAAGTDGVLFTPPPYARPGEDEVLAFYREVAAQVGAPIMAYNWPRGTGIDMSTDLIAALAQIPNVISIKDSTPDYQEHLGTLQRLGRNSQFFANYISKIGIGVLTELGGSGSIEGGALCAERGVAFFEAYWRGDIEAAREHGKVYDQQLSSFIGYDFAGRFGTQIPQIKAAMRLLGQPGGYCRRPYRDFDEEQTARLAAHLRSLGML